MALKWDLKFWIKVAIMIAIVPIVGALPPVGAITPFGMKVLGVFISVVFGWIAIDIMMPAVYGFVALCLIGSGTVVGNLQAAFGNMTVMMVLFSALFAGAIERTGCIDVVNKFLLTRKILEGRPWLLVGTILLIAYFGSVLNCGFAAIFLLWALAIKLCKSAGYEAKSPILCYLVANIVIVNISTGQAFPWKAGTLAYMGFAGMVEFPMIPYIGLTNLFMLIFIVLVVLIGKYVLRIDASKLVLTEDEMEKFKNMKANQIQIIGLVSIVLFIACMIVPNLLSSGAFKEIMAKIGLVGWIFIIMIFLSLLKDNDGKRIIPIEACFSSVPWPVVFIIGVAMPLGDAMKSPDSGIMATVMTTVSSAFSGMDPVIFMIIATLAVALLTQVLNNMVLGAVLMPVLLPVCSQLGGNPYILFLMLLYVLNCAYLTPAGSLQGAMIHGHAVMDKKWAYSHAAIALGLQFLLCIVVFMGIGSFVL